MLYDFVLRPTAQALMGSFVGGQMQLVSQLPSALNVRAPAKIVRRSTGRPFTLFFEDPASQLAVIFNLSVDNMPLGVAHERITP